MRGKKKQVQRTKYGDKSLVRLIDVVASDQTKHKNNLKEFLDGHKNRIKQMQEGNELSTALELAVTDF